MESIYLFNKASRADTTLHLCAERYDNPFVHKTSFSEIIRQHCRVKEVKLDSIVVSSIYRPKGWRNKLSVDFVRFLNSSLFDEFFSKDTLLTFSYPLYHLSRFYNKITRLVLSVPAKIRIYVEGAWQTSLSSMFEDVERKRILIHSRSTEQKLETIFQ